MWFAVAAVLASVEPRWEPTCLGRGGAFDFIEVGTNDEDTLIQQAPNCSRGLSVEAVAHYLDRLPVRPNVRKVHAAVVPANYSGATVDFVGVSPEDIARHKHELPSCIGQMGSAGKPTAMMKQALRQLNLTHLLRVERTPALTFGALLEREDVVSVEYLKVAPRRPPLRGCKRCACACARRPSAAISTPRRYCDAHPGPICAAVWQIDVEGAEFDILASLMAACETQPSLWPRRIVYEQKHHGRATKLHWLGCFTRDGRYTTVSKPKEMQRHGRTKYNLDSFDMVLDRRDPVPRSVVPSKCKVAS
eukprot:Transcript_7883.p2 GENE.Transcript_7883~~Transcript_7883.p2  ORF type:complete len:305 (-),score=39.85 Transcript_7883:150-1064(-)